MVKRTTSPRWPRWLAGSVLGLAAASLVVGGVVTVGNLARNSLGPHERYLVSFNEIDCPAPPDQTREVFLGEVQYLGVFKDKLDILDQTLPEQLRLAFSKHARVASVDKITIIPPKRIRIDLTFRRASP